MKNIYICEPRFQKKSGVYKKSNYCTACTVHGYNLSGYLSKNIHEYGLVEPYSTSYSAR